MPSIVVTACRCIPDEKVRRAIELRLSLFFFSTPARRTVFSLLRAALSLHFSQSISSFESKRCRHSKTLQQPLEAFRLKLSLSYMARRTFSSGIHRQANLNGQAARRGLEIHFPRYQFQHEPDQQAFQRTLLTLLQQIPLKVEIKPLVDQWSYFYERSIGCIGILKDWLVRALAASLATRQSELLLERIQECALPIAQCESMALEAAAGEQELHYTA